MTETPLDAETAAGPIVVTDTGPVRGVAEPGLNWFRDIPYAAPPVGELRFKAPAPHAPWSAVRDGARPGPNAPQILGNFPGLDVAPLVGDAWRRGDDYLTVNVWTPDAAIAPGAKGRPVMVFVHGGGFVLGCNDTAITDGSAFARSGVVLMAVNYRLGVEGFAPVPGAPTNLGLRDIIAALQWVQRNAAAFGGDAGNVTLFGESAGAMAIAALMASPLARGLFSKTIIESGHGQMVRPLPVAARLVSKLARLLRVAPTAEGFRTRTVEQALQALTRVQNPLTRLDLRDEHGREPVFGISRFIPVVGDDVIPEHPLSALKTGAGAEINMLIGTNREEMNLYFVPTGVRARLTGWLAILMLRRSEPRAREILKAYGLGKAGRKPGFVFTEAMHDLVFRLPARWFAAAHGGTTHVYEMEWRGDQFGGELGACHGIELPFVFNTLASCTGREGFAGTNPPQDLADRVHGLWVGFAKTGTLPWPEYDAAGRVVYALEAGRAEREAVMLAEGVLG
ncbi:MAG: carboxylesterase [Caulobacter sp.]|nr:carboxylesterase [Caulobacter sp.]